MNILIPLGNGSRWQDNELRYCLRGIEKHLAGWGKIVIVGRLPEWIKENDRLVFIPKEDNPGAKWRERNIHFKTMAAIQSGHCGESFLFMNDDHFLLSDFEASMFPYHHKGALQKNFADSRRYNAYRKTLANTLGQYPEGMNYDTHCPIVYESEKYLQTFDKPFPAYGYAIKTMYCEGQKVDGDYYPDCKLNSPEGIAAAVEGRQYFSIGNKAIGPELEDFLQRIYPNPSAFEI